MGRIVLIQCVGSGEDFVYSLCDHWKQNLSLIIRAFLDFCLWHLLIPNVCFTNAFTPIL